MTNLEHIVKELKSTPTEGVYKAKEIIKEKIKNYRSIEAKINSHPRDKVRAHSFVSEVLRESEKREKQSYKKRLMKALLRLERHAYAPEMNKLHFKGERSFNVPQVQTIEAGIDKLIERANVITIKKILL